MRTQPIKLYGPLVIMAVLFVIASVSAEQYKETIEKTIQGHHALGIATYIGITIAAVVVAPVSATPLIPVAANLWGVLWAGVFSIVGWLGGALIAFGLARRYGTRIVERFASPEQIKRLHDLVPERNMFWTIVLLRMMIPVDVLSYALGLLGNISWQTYALATLIGITPFAFVLAYVGTIELWLQLSLFVVALPLVILLLRKTS